VAVTLVFPGMLSTSVLIGRPQKQSSVTLNYPSEKSCLQCGLSSKFFDQLSTALLVFMWLQADQRTAQGTGGEHDDSERSHHVLRNQERQGSYFIISLV